MARPLNSLFRWNSIYIENDGMHRQLNFKLSGSGTKTLNELCNVLSRTCIRILIFFFWRCLQRPCFWVVWVQKKNQADIGSFINLCSSAAPVAIQVVLVCLQSFTRRCDTGSQFHYIVRMYTILRTCSEPSYVDGYFLPI